MKSALQFLPIAALALFAMLTQQARAAETVTLRSGFTVTCVSREPLGPDTVRLHLRSSGADNYMDVRRDAIARVEPAPEEAVAMPSHTNAAQTDTGAILQSSGAAHNVNVALLASVVQAESGGNSHAVSRTGARGLMQLMPVTAAQLGVTDSFSPENNVNGGSTYLDQLLTRYHDNLPLALAAYNAGPGAVDRFHGVPPFRETRLYVAKVIREFNRRVAAQGSTARATLATGLQKPGR